MRWRFASGAQLQFGYLDHPNDHYRYQSSEFQFIGFDELTQFQEHQYRYLFSRLRRLTSNELPLRMRSASNPGGIGHDWVKQSFVTHPEDRVFIPATLADNQHIDQSSYIESLSRLTADERERLLMGNWDVADDRLVSYEDMLGCSSSCLWPDHREPSGWSELYLGVDIGRSHDLTVIWTWEKVGDVALTRDVTVLEQTTFKEQIEEISRRLTRNVVACWVDKGFNPQVAEDLEREFPHVVEGVQLTSGRMGQFGQMLAVATSERRVRVPDDEEIRSDWRMVRKVDTRGDVPRLATDRNQSGHGDRFWAAALGYAALAGQPDQPRAFTPRARVSSLARRF